MDLTREELTSDFTREELQGLTSRADREEGLAANPHWKTAYRNLSEAACTLDAFFSRSTDGDTSPTVV